MANATDQLFVGGGEFLAGAAKIVKSEEGGGTLPCFATATHRIHNKQRCYFASHNVTMLYVSLCP